MNIKLASTVTTNDVCAELKLKEKTWAEASAFYTKPPTLWHGRHE